MQQRFVLGAVSVVACLALLAGCSPQGKSYSFSLSGGQRGEASTSGDCLQRDLSLSGIEYDVDATGDIAGSGELSLVSLQRANCLTGDFAGGWVIEAGGSDVLIGHLNGEFTLQPTAGPTWKADGIKLNVVGGSGRYAGAKGSGQCNASGTLTVETSASGRVQVACKLTLQLAG